MIHPGSLKTETFFRIIGPQNKKRKQMILFGSEKKRFLGMRFLTPEQVADQLVRAGGASWAQAAAQLCYRERCGIMCCSGVQRECMKGNSLAHVP